MGTERPAEVDAWKYAQKTMSWYGWGSPVGLGLFVLSIGGFILLLHMAGLLR